MDVPSKDILIFGKQNISAFGARWSRISDVFDLRLGDIAAKGLRGWWLTPSRTGVHRLIAPWEYRHLRAFAAMRIAGGSAAAAAGVVCLSYGGYRWAAFFLVLAALNLAGGWWFLTIARSASART